MGALVYDHEHWGVDQELAAETIEMGHAILGRLGQLVSLTAGKNAKKVEPLQLPRPAYLEEARRSRKYRKRGTSLDQLKSMMGKGEG